MDARSQSTGTISGDPRKTAPGHATRDTPEGRVG